MSGTEDDDGFIMGDRGPGAPLTGDRFVQVTVPVHVEDLPSFYEALATWSRTAEGGKGRVRMG
jgi:hypothetical protein